MQQIYQLKARAFFSKNYDEFLTLNWYIACLKTGKSAKKSTVVAKHIVKRILKDPTLNVVVLKKLMKDHQKTTMVSIEKAFNRLQELTGYDWRRFWDFKPNAQNPRVENKVTGQVILFVSFDRPDSLGGLEIADPRMYFGIVWFEEPLQISLLTKQIDEETERRQFDIIINSSFRQNLQAWQFNQLIFTFNDWSDGDNWIIQKYIKPYLQENEEILDKKAKMIYYNPNGFAGKGIFVGVMSAGVNEFNTDDFKRQVAYLKKNDYEFYKAIWLGTSSNFIGNAYTNGNIKKINWLDEKINFKNISVFRVGIDYSSIKDYTVILLIGIIPETKQVIIVDGWRYHRGKTKNPMSETQLADRLFLILKFWAQKYEMKNRIRKTRIFIDSRESLLRSIITQKFLQDKFIRIDYMAPERASKFNSARSFIRVMSTRWLMASGKLYLSPKLKWLLDEFKKREILKDGSIKDGGDDGPQTFEYALSKDWSWLLPRTLYIGLIQQFASRNKENFASGYQSNNF